MPAAQRADEQARRRSRRPTAAGSPRASGGRPASGSRRRPAARRSRAGGRWRAPGAARRRSRTRSAGPPPTMPISVPITGSSTLLAPARHSGTARRPRPAVGLGILLAPGVPAATLHARLAPAALRRPRRAARTPPASAPPRCGSRSPAITAFCIVIGTKTSSTTAATEPWKSGGAMPMMVNDRPLSVTGAPDGRRIAGEHAAPEIVRDDGDGVAIRHEPSSGAEARPSTGLHAEELEEVRRHELAEDADRLVARRAGSSAAAGTPTRSADAVRLRGAQILEVGIRHAEAVAARGDAAARRGCDPGARRPQAATAARPASS